MCEQGWKQGKEHSHFQSSDGREVDLRECLMKNLVCAGVATGNRGELPWDAGEAPASWLAFPRTHQVRTSGRFSVMSPAEHSRADHVSTLPFSLSFRYASLYLCSSPIVFSLSYCWIRSSVCSLNSGSKVLCQLSFSPIFWQGQPFMWLSYCLWNLRPLSPHSFDTLAPHF